jgi:hypothetical protein
VLVAISRRQVEEADLDSILDGLRALSADRDSALMYRGQMTIYFDIDDEREIVDIPEARALLARLVNEWPLWAHFASQVDGTVHLLLSCACAKRSLGRGRVEADRNLLGAVLEAGWNATVDLHLRLGLDAEGLQAHLDGLLERVEQADG